MIINAEIKQKDIHILPQYPPFQQTNHYVPQFYLKRWMGTQDKIWTYRILVENEKAAIELLKLTQQQKGGWLYDKLRIRMMMLVDSVQVFRRKLKDAKFSLK